MVKQLLVSAILTVMFYCNTFACLNGASKILKNGTVLYEDSEGSVPFGHDFYKDNFESGLRKLDSLYKVTNDLDYLSDKGLLLILLERYKEAIALYLEIERTEPNRYSTASNIGTAYELFGQNENALKWIKKAVELDPKSHHNSEWIHVKILEAKIKGEQFYTTSFLLNTEFGSDSLPNSQMSKQQLRDLFDALYYQLNERISFVKPREKIVAQLLFDLGNIAFLLDRYFEAAAIYEQAKLFGYTGQIIEQRLKEVDTLSKKPKQTKKSDSSKLEESHVTFWPWTIAGTFVTTLAIVFFSRRRKSRV